MSFARDDGCIVYGEIDAYAVHPDLSKAHVAGRQFHIRRYQYGDAVADPCLYAQGQVDGGKESIGCIGILEVPACLPSKEVIIIIAMFLSEQVAGDAGAGKENGIARHAEIIA